MVPYASASGVTFGLYIAGQVTWADARTTCNSYGADLAWFDSMSQYTDVASYYKSEWGWAGVPKE